jgi:hypothetical protein
MLLLVWKKKKLQDLFFFFFTVPYLGGSLGKLELEDDDRERGQLFIIIFHGWSAARLPIELQLSFKKQEFASNSQPPVSYRYMKKQNNAHPS